MDEFLDELTPGQFDEWLAFDLLEGLGLHRLERVLAMVGSGLAGVWGGEVEPERFLPDDIAALRQARRTEEERAEIEALRARRVAKKLGAIHRRR